MCEEFPAAFEDRSPGQDRPPGRRKGAPLVAALAAIVLVAGGISVGWGLSRTDHGAVSAVLETPAVTEAPITPAPPRQSTAQADAALDVEAITDEVSPAVVDIETVVDGDPFDSFPASGGGAGTGMVLTPSGEILTNNHVIEGASAIEVTFFGRSGSYEARVVGAAPEEDVALLQVQGGASDLPTVTLEDSSVLRIGQPVVAIGNALGRPGPPTVTEGTISALNRSITVQDGRGGAEDLSGLIQTDAPIQPGDSGGPLVNSQGHVVGMITAGSSGRRASSREIGFAITSNAALEVVNDIRAGRSSPSIVIGEVGYLGVGVQDLDAATAARLGLGVSSGALVVGVVPGGPADGAGIARNAVITSIDGRTITSSDDLGPAIRQHRPGDRIRVTWVDRRGTHTETVRLTTGPAV